MPGKHADAEPLPDEVRQKLSEIGHVIPADAVLGCWPERNVTAEQKECLEKHFALAYFSGKKALLMPFLPLAVFASRGCKAHGAHVLRQFLEGREKNRSSVSRCFLGTWKNAFGDGIFW